MKGKSGVEKNENAEVSESEKEKVVVVEEGKKLKPKGTVWKTKAFMKKFANLQGTRTRSGYNPLISDFSNTSIFTVPPPSLEE